MEMPNEKSPDTNRNQGAQSAHFELAKARISAIDAKSDGSTSGDEELREEALKFIRKECLSLPDREFMALLSKIEDALRRRDAEISNVLDESQAALQEVSQELSILPYSNFEPWVPNPKGVAEYLEASVRTKGGERAFMEALRKNTTALAGFVMNWNEKHPVRMALTEMGKQGTDAAKKLDIAAHNEKNSADRLDGESVDYKAKFSELQGARDDFKKLTDPEFPSTKDPKTTETVISVFERLDGTASLSDPYLMLLRDAKTTLAFIREWAKYPNPTAEAMKNHPNEGVRTGYHLLQSAAIAGAVKYGFDFQCLPYDFEKVAKEKLDRFQRREKHAAEVSKWNEESRNFLIGKWNDLVQARREGDSSAVTRIGEEANAFFNGEFKTRHEKANEYFFWLVDEQQPQEYKELQSIAGTRQLFAWMRATIGNGGTKRGNETEAAVSKFDESFQSMIWGTWTYLLTKDENGKFDTRLIGSFVEDVTEETVTQTVRDPEWIARYLSYAYVRGGKKDFAAMIRSDFGKNYDALILKFADTAGFVSKGLAENSGKWKEIIQTLSYTDKEAGEMFESFLKKEADAILSNREAFSDDGFGLLSKELVHRHGSKKTEEIISQMRGKNTKEQFDVLLRNCPEYTHGQVERLFVELGKRSELAADAHKVEAERIIPGKEIVEYVPGFVRLKFALASPIGKETVKEAEARTDILRALQESDRMTADAFYEKYAASAEYLIRALEIRGKEFPYERADCEVFAEWLRHKHEGDKKREDSLVQAEIARTAKELAAKKWPDAKAVEDKSEYDARIDEFTEFAKSVVRNERMADALESQGKKEEADELRQKIAESKKERGAEKVSDEGWNRARTTPSDAAEAIVGWLPAGREVKVPLQGVSADIRVLRTNDAATPFVISVEGKKSYVCGEKELSANLQMAEFLSKNSLAFLAPISSELLKRSSVSKGSLATASDGDFDDREKRELLSAAAKALKIEGFPHGSTDLDEMSARFSRISREEGTSVRELGKKNGVLDESGDVRNVEEFLSSAT